MGVAKVLSHTLIAPCFLQMAAIAARSTTFSVGLVGVSTHTMPALFLARCASRREASVRSR